MELLMQKEEKSIRSAFIIFKSRHESLLGAFFLCFAPNAASTPTRVNEILPLWAKPQSETPNVIPQVLWQSVLNAAFPVWPHTLPIPQNQTIQSVSFWVSSPLPSLFTTNPAFLPAGPAMVCNRAITVFQSSLSLQPHGRKVYQKNKWKSQKRTLLLTGMGMNRVIVQSTVVALALSHCARSLPRRVSAGEL